MEKIPKNKLAPKGQLPFNANKCTFCKYWKRKSQKNGICEKMNVYFFANQKRMEITVPRYGLCDKFERRDGVPVTSSDNSLHKHNVSGSFIGLLPDIDTSKYDKLPVYVNGKLVDK